MEDDDVEIDWCVDECISWCVEYLGWLGFDIDECIDLCCGD